MKYLFPIFFLLILNGCINIERHSVHALRYRVTPSFKGDYVSADALESEPTVVFRSEARLPKKREGKSLHGYAKVMLLVDESGVPSQIQTIEASDLSYAVAAQRCVGSWSFKPGMRNGEAVKSVFTVDVDFSTRMNKLRQLKGPEYRDPPKLIFLGGYY